MYEMNSRTITSASFTALIFGAVSVLWTAAPTHADVDGFDGPMVTMDWMSSNGSSQQFTMHQDSNDYWYSGGDSAWVFQGGAADQDWGMDWQVQAANQPGAAQGGGSQFVNANLAVTNNSASFQTFTALVTLSLPNEFTGGTLMSGLVSASVQDVQDNGAEIRSVDGMPIYRAFIDDTPPGGAVQSLFDPFYSLAAPAGNTVSDSDTFGFPNQVAGPAALDTISVMLHFELSPGDTANVVGSFQIEQALPAPAALPLLAGFGLAFGSSRRRPS